MFKNIENVGVAHDEREAEMWQKRMQYTRRSAESIAETKAEQTAEAEQATPRRESEATQR